MRGIKKMDEEYKKLLIENFMNILISVLNMLLALINFISNESQRLPANRT